MSSASLLSPHMSSGHSPNISVLDHMNFYQVIVIGAGIAGLAAAKTLIDNGLQDLKILEAQDHPGGRISSVFLNGSWIEVGAQWIHGQNNEVWKLAHKYDLLSTVTSSEGEGVYIREDGVVFDPTLVEEVCQVVTEILQECEEYAYGYCDKKAIPKSIGQHLKQKFERYLESCSEDSEELRRMKEELYDWHLRFQVIDNSCTVLDKLSAKAWGSYSFSGGTDYINFKEGYGSLVRTIVKELPAGMLCLNSPVTAIKWQQSINLHVQNDTALGTICNKLNGVHMSPFHADIHGGMAPQTHRNGIESGVPKTIGKPPVVVFCSNGAVYTAGHVIVTCSLGCLKACCKTMFEPELPHSMIQAVQDMGFAAVNKIFLVFEKPWWTSDIRGFQLIWSRDNNVTPSHKERSSWTRDLTGFDVIYGQEGVLLGWVGGKGAELVEEMTEDEIGQQCTELLKKFTMNENIPLPCQVIRSQWYKNPYIRGGYSNSSNMCDVSSRGPSDLAAPVWADVCYGNMPTECKYPVILLAGEATHERYFSTTHGAYETGQAQAKVILDYINSQRSSSL